MNSSEFEKTIKKIGACTQAELGEYREEYKKRYGAEADFDKDLLTQTKGKLHNEAERVLQGLPENPVLRQLAIADRNISRVDEQRAGGANAVLDFFGSEKGHTLDQRADEIAKIRTEISNTGIISAEQYRKICNLNQAVSADLGMHAEAKQAAVDTSAKIATSLAVSFVPGGWAIRAAVGAATYTGSKITLEGGAAYEADGLPKDIVVGGGFGVGAAAGKAAGASAKELVHKLGNPLVSETAKIAGAALSEDGTKAIIDNVTNPRNYEGDNPIAEIVTGSLTDAVSNAGISVASKIVPVPGGEHTGKIARTTTKYTGKELARTRESGVEEESRNPNDSEIGQVIPPGGLAIAEPDIAIAKATNETARGPETIDPRSEAAKAMRAYVSGKSEVMPIELTDREQQLLSTMRARQASHENITLTGADAGVYKGLMNKLYKHFEGQP